MIRAIFLNGVWLCLTCILYVEWVVLELCWNLYDWQPSLHARSLAIFFAIGSTMTVWWFLAKIPLGRTGRIVPSVCCLALAALAIYVFPAEPLTQGVFSRQLASPLWYRGGRSLVLGLPGTFWLIQITRVYRNL
jgi:hypothetical protein